MVDIPSLRKIAEEGVAVSLNPAAARAASGLHAALDEIEGLRLRLKMAEESKEHYVFEQGELLKVVHAALLYVVYLGQGKPETTEYARIGLVNAVCQFRARYSGLTKETTDKVTDCPDCGIGPCESDPTSVTSATPRCFRPGYCGEPGQMSRPRVDCIVNGNRMGLWDEVQMRVGEKTAP